MKLQAWAAAAAVLHAGASLAQPAAPELVARWTVDRTLLASRAGPAPLALSLTLVTLRETGWGEPRMVETATAAADLLAPCGIALAGVVVLTYAGGPAQLRDLWTPASRELARIAAPPRPAVFFVAGTRHRPAFDAEAFGVANTATRPELAHTVWVTAGARDLPIVVAHELVHVLSGSGEHSALPRNLMREDTAPGATALTPAQCAAVRDHGTRAGLLRPWNGQAAAAAAAGRGTTNR